MTVWPGVPLPLPSLVRRGNYHLDRTRLAIIGGDGRVEVENADRREVYLKLHALNLNDQEAIAAFANTYGAPSLTAAALPNMSWFSGLYSDTQDRATRELALQSDPSLQELMTITDSNPDPPWIIPLDSFRFAANLLSDLTDAWRATNLDPTFDLANHHWRLPYAVDAETPLDRRFAFSLLCSVLPPFLKDFSPSIAPVGWYGQEEPLLHPLPHAGVIADVNPAVDSYTVTSYCALELFNHIVEAEIYRTCHNEHCSNLFVRQYGRAEHGQSKREGVMYCSRHCAQAQAARDYRRRQAKRRELATKENAPNET